MICLLATRQPIFRRVTYRLANRTVARLQDGGVPSDLRSSAFSTATILPPVLPPPSPPPPQNPQAEKGVMGKVMNRYSVQGSQNRIRVAEAFFQAATRQGADP